MPGIQALARKSNLAKNLMRMLKEKELKDEYNFFPKTWQLPADSTDLKNQFSNPNKKKQKTFIIKPVHMCQGRGIYMV